MIKRIRYDARLGPVEEFVDEHTRVNGMWLRVLLRCVVCGVIFDHSGRGSMCPARCEAHR